MPAHAQLDDALSIFLEDDGELRALVVQFLKDALDSLRHDMKYGSPQVRSQVYRSVIASLVRASTQRNDDEGMDALREQFDDLRREMMVAKPTTKSQRDATRAKLDGKK